MSKVITEETIRDLHYEQGLTYREVAEVLNVHPVSVAQAVKSMGLKGRVHWVKDTFLTEPQLRKLMAEDKLGPKEIAAKYGISDETVRDLAYKYGLEEFIWNGGKYRWTPGDTIGAFTILKRGKTEKRQLHWHVRCNRCNQESYKSSQSIAKYKSCGCLKRDDEYFKEWGKMISKANTTHGFSRHPLYHSWLKIIKRCNDPKYRDYPRYGGRGITCEFEDVADFIYWAVKKGGWKKGKHCHRIDNNGPYSPENCIFMTPGDHSRLHWKTNPWSTKKKAKK